MLSPTSSRNLILLFLLDSMLLLFSVTWQRRLTASIIPSYSLNYLPLGWMNHQFDGSALTCPVDNNKSRYQNLQFSLQRYWLLRKIPSHFLLFPPLLSAYHPPSRWSQECLKVQSLDLFSFFFSSMTLSLYIPQFILLSSQMILHSLLEIPTRRVYSENPQR